MSQFNNIVHCQTGDHKVGYCFTTECVFSDKNRVDGKR